jgi:hypothetical protein
MKLDVPRFGRGFREIWWMLRYALYLDCREGTSIVAENSIDTIDLFRNTQNSRLRRRGRCICPYSLRI